MNITFYKNQLADLLRANQSRKLKLANKAGYTDPKSYKEDLESIISGCVGETTEEPKIKTKNPIIHNVYVLDRSYSMEDLKFNNAVDGINNEIQELKKDESIDTNITLLTFGDVVDTVINKMPILDVGVQELKCGGMTALYDAICSSIDLSKNTLPNEKVLIKIFTDGHENYSKSTLSQVKDQLKLAKHLNFTTTFVGTALDVKRTVNLLGVEESNTLIHNNTPKDIKRVFDEGLVATAAYRQKVIKGENVKTGFYKSINK